LEPHTKPLILVVDDNETIRKLVSTILVTYDMDVTSVGDGEQALEYLQTRRPDLMLLDVSMPHLDGVEVLRQVRAHPSLHDLNVIMLTAVANSARFDEVHAYKPNGYLEKPFRINDLIGAVRKALSRPG